MSGPQAKVSESKKDTNVFSEVVFFYSKLAVII